MSWSPHIPQAVKSDLPPYGIKPHWVTFTFSASANRLYDLYNAHVDRNRGDTVVWPTLDDLAAMMGLSRGDKVSRYMRELEAGGAIAVETITKTGGEGRRYIVTVKTTPPADYGGPLQSGDWHNAHRKQRTTMRDRALGEETAGGKVHPLKGGDPHPLKGGDVPPTEGGVRSNQVNQNQTKNSAADAVGQSAGGFAPAGARDSAADETGEDRGGSAASGKTSPSPRKTTRNSKRPAKVKTTSRKAAPGYDAVRAAVPAAVARPGTALYPGLTRAINDVLRGNPGAGIPARTPGQVVARLNRRWYGENAETRAAADYRGCDRCTASGCEAPRRSEQYPDGCDRIKNPSSWLAAAILTQDCPDPACDDGQLIDGRGACERCAERSADRKQAADAASALAARLEEETVTVDEDQEQHDNGGGYGVPRQVTTWRCEGDGCGRPGRGVRPLLRLCDECQEDAALQGAVASAPS